MTPPKLPTRTHITVVALMGLTFIAMGVFGLQETLDLVSSNSVATAKVIDSRESFSLIGKSYDVKYVFSPADGLPEVGRADFTGRSALWASLPQNLWKIAISTGQLQIRYDPRNPMNNAPVDDLPSFGGPICGLVLGGFLLFSVVVVERTRRLRLSSP